MELPDVIKYFPETCDECCLETAAILGMITSVVGDIGICQELTPAVGNAALEEVSPPGYDLLVECLLEG